MPKVKVNVDASFDLVLDCGGKLQPNVLRQFKKELKTFINEYLYYYTYKDSSEGSYDDDVIPQRIKVKVTKEIERQ